MILILLFILLPVTGFANDAEFQVTHPKAVEAMMGLARVGPGEVLYDLGSGDGRIVIAAATYGAEAIGIERDPLLAKISTNFIKQRQFATGSARIIKGDFFRMDYPRATVITMYLPQAVTDRLEPKLRGLKGVKIISNGTLIGKWQPVKTVDIGQGLCTPAGFCTKAPLYMWIP